uniref:RING-type E3 ubiquitin transferase (cysteine targeting) n=3 Tax=Rhodnius TaxID=13248 RepID=T1I1V2_RHOPR
MAQREVEVTPTRIAVLDSTELDHEIFSLLKNQLNSIITNLPLEFTYFEPELQTFLKIALWMLSVERTSATFGQQLLRLKYTRHTPSRTLSVLGILQIGASYLKQRLPSFLSFCQFQSASDLSHKIIDWGEFVTNIISILYFVKFLRKGGAPTFLEYLLGVKPVSTVPPSSRNIGYSFMTRDLIWHGLIEFLVLVIPMINYHALKRRFKKYLMYNTPVKKDEFSHQEMITKYNLKCAVCKDFPILPHHMGCNHLFCYYCLLSHRLADNKFECPICGYTNPEVPILPLSLK